MEVKLTKLLTDLDISALKSIQQTSLNCQHIDEALPSDSRMKIPDGPKINWHTDFSQVPKGPSLIIAQVAHNVYNICCENLKSKLIHQELFDALPVHQFEYSSKYAYCKQFNY